MMNGKLATFGLMMLIVASFFTFNTPQLANAENLTFNTAINLSDNDTVSTWHEVAVSGNNVYVVWQDNLVRSDGTVETSNILIKVSTDGGVSFRDLVSIGTSYGSPYGPKIAASGDNVYVVWVDNKKVQFSRSTDRGSDFSLPVTLSEGNKDSNFPQIAAYGKSVYVVWEYGDISYEAGVFTNTEILIRVSNDNGVSFSPAINLSNNNGTSSIGGFAGAKIAAYGNDVYVVWQDLTPGNFDVFLARSTDNGSTFDTVNLTNTSGNSAHPTVAAFGNNVYVAYQDDTHTGGRGAHYEVFFARSADRGQNFAIPIKMSNQVDAEDPKIVVSGKHVYMIWHDASEFSFGSGSIKIFFARSTDGGKTFDPSINLSGNGWSVNAWLAVSGNSVYVGWQEKISKRFEAFFRASTDYGANFSPAVNLSNGVGDSGAPIVVASGANVYTVWMDNGVGNADIFFRAATNPLLKLDPTIAEIESEYIKSSPKQSTQSNNLTFSNSINLSNDDAGVAFYEIASSGNYVYVVWSGAAVSDSGQFVGSADIFFRVIKDNGASFNDVINLSKNSGNSIYPRIAVSGNNVYVVWQDDGQGGREVFFARSADNGATFSTPINISNDFSDSVFPQISVSRNNVYVVWQNGMASGVPGARNPNSEIFFVASKDNGTTFESVINLSKNSGYGSLNSFTTNIASYGNNVYVVWQDDTPGNLDVFLARSKDNGATFETVNLSNNSGGSHHPEIAAFGSNVYVIWSDDTNQGGLGANADIFFARSTDSAASFSDAVTLWNNNGVSGGGAKIAANSNNVYVVWFEGKIKAQFNDFDVFFVRSTDNGANFDNPVNLSNNVGMSSNPAIATSGSKVYVGWQDNAPSNGDPSGNWEAFLRVSTDNGASFGSLINVSNNEGPSFAPKIALSGDNVYLVWMDNSVGNGDIFFAVGSTKKQSITQMPKSLAPITINSINNPKPRWGLDEVTIAGTAKASSLDIITIDWGDGNISNVRFIKSDGSWGPVSHIYDVEHVGKKQIVAKLFSGRVLKASSTYEVDVQKHATSITIDEIPDVKPATSITVKGLLFDEDAKVGISGRIITFNGTGASDLERTVTFKEGMFSSKGTAPSKASAGLTAQAHFAGDSVYLASSSNVVTYNAGKSAEEEPKASDKPKEKVVGEPKEKIETSDAINVEMKQKKDLTLISVKNNNAEDVFEIKIKVSDGKIKFIKARGWDRERVDQSTVIVSTDDRPVTAGRNLIIILIADNTSSLEWSAANEKGTEIAKGIIHS